DRAQPGASPRKLRGGAGGPALGLPLPYPHRPLWSWWRRPHHLRGGQQRALLPPSLRADLLRGALGLRGVPGRLRPAAAPGLRPGAAAPAHRPPLGREPAG
ncbi:unnamed protein product, partial [Effrenium voratum]